MRILAPLLSSSDKSAERRVVEHFDRPTRRTAMRYPVKAEVFFWWKDGNDIRRGSGTSRDVSEKGAFVNTPAFPPAGAQVELRFFFPQLSETTPAGRLEVEGTVLRVEEAGGGFAVLTKTAILRENDESGGGNFGDFTTHS